MKLYRTFKTIPEYLEFLTNNPVYFFNILIFLCLFISGIIYLVRILYVIYFLVKTIISWIFDRFSNPDKNNKNDITKNDIKNIYFIDFIIQKIFNFFYKDE